MRLFAYRYAPEPVEETTRGRRRKDVLIWRSQEAIPGRQLSESRGKFGSDTFTTEEHLEEGDTQTVVEAEGGEYLMSM